MKIPMVRTAERDRELIAHFHPERSWLGKAQVMRVCRLSAANKAWLSGNELQMLLVADAFGFAELQD
jgi:hypothetical protein